jgi:hypothetical protein
MRAEAKREPAPTIVIIPPSFNSTIQGIQHALPVNPWDNLGIP